MSMEYSNSTGKIDVAYVARLARLQLSAAESQDFQAQLDQILAYVRQLQQVDVEGVKPTAHAVNMKNVFRDDKIEPGLDRDKVLANAPVTRNSQFIVPKIIE